MGRAYASADLVICRAGASTCFELCLLGKAALLIPLPTAVRNHQHANAAALVKALGDQALVRMQQMEASLSCFEVRLTDTFCAKLAAMDRVAETLAC